MKILFCIYCGKEINGKSSFCKYCGQRLVPDGAGNDPPKSVIDLKKHTPDKKPRIEPPINATTASVPQNDDQPQSQDAIPHLGNSSDASSSASPLPDGWPERMRQIVFKNTEYYAREFDSLKNGRRNKINWAAFFLQLYHASYRNVTMKWFAAVGKPLIACQLMALLTFAIMSVNLTAAAISALISIITGIWFVVAEIMYARNFNRIYMDHVEKKLTLCDDSPDPSLKRAFFALFEVFYFAFAVYFFIIFGAMGIVNLLDSALSDSVFREFIYDFYDGYFDDYAPDYFIDGYDNPDTTDYPSDDSAFYIPYSGDDITSSSDSPSDDTFDYWTDTYPDTDTDDEMENIDNHALSSYLGSWVIDTYLYPGVSASFSIYENGVPDGYNIKLTANSGNGNMNYDVPINVEYVDAESSIARGYYNDSSGGGQIIVEKYMYSMDIDVIPGTSNDGKDSILSGSCYKAGEDPIPANAKAWDSKIYEALCNYIYGLTRAINTGDFSYVSPVFVGGSQIYNDQLKLVNSLGSQGITEEVIDFSMTSYSNLGDGYGTVTSDETIRVHKADDTSKDVHQKYTYYLKQQADSSWLMYDMKEVK